MDIPMSVLLYSTFNPRSYKRSDPDFVFPLILIMLSIHAPTRGATFHTFLNAHSINTFNPRSYKRSDITVPPIDGLSVLSIHAPTRGATVTNLCSVLEPPLSIHAPTRGATLFFLVISLYNQSFNPRSYKRSDIS